MDAFVVAIVVGLLTVLIALFAAKSLRRALIKGGPSKKSMLLPPRPKHKVQPRRDLVANIASLFTELRKGCPDRDTVVVVYVQGPPAFGKTQLACQFAEDFERRVS